MESPQKLRICGLAVIGRDRLLLGNAPGCMLGSMIKTLSNWTFREVTNFLRAHDFSFYESSQGLGELWIKLTAKGEPDTFVEVPFTHGLYKSKALKKIIRQSGIPEAEWMKWVEVSAENAD